MKAISSGDSTLPPQLKEGDTLHIVATSNSVAGFENLAEKAYAQLGAWGLKIKEAPNCRSVYGHAAGTIQERACALHAAFTDPESAAIMAFWGGAQTHQLLEYLDFDLIRAHPKIVIGYSDTSALLLALHAKAKLRTFMGPAAITLAKPVQFPYTQASFRRVLMEACSSYTLKASKEYSDTLWWKTESKKMHVEASPPWQCFQKGSAEGTCVAANAGTMLLLEGTEWMPCLEGAILFLEEDEVETPHSVDRIFTRMRHLGIFEKIKGLVVGRFMRSVGFREKDSFEMILKDALKGHHFPVMTGCDFGHTDPIATLPLGAHCQLDAEKLEIDFQGPFTSPA